MDIPDLKLICLLFANAAPLARKIIMSLKAEHGE